VIVGAPSTYSIVNPREENRTANRSGYLDQDAIDVSGWTSFRPQCPIPIMLAPDYDVQASASKISSARVKQAT
jgi:hypothetical protein